MFTKIEGYFEEENMDSQNKVTVFYAKVSTVKNYKYDKNNESKKKSSHFKTRSVANSPYWK